MLEDSLAMPSFQKDHRHHLYGLKNYQEIKRKQTKIKKILLNAQESIITILYNMQNLILYHILFSNYFLHTLINFDEISCHILRDRRFRQFSL